MEQLKQILLFIHITCGTLALLAGPIAMLNQNGNNLHRKSGKIFFYAMTIVFFTAIYLSVAGNIPFLFLIAIFSYYNIVVGYRALYLKKLGSGQKPELFDWSITILTTLFHAALLVWGIVVLFIQGDNFGIVASIFGILGGLGNYREYLHYIKGYTTKNGWLYVHISGMLGGYIATLTAFLVNVVTFQPSFVLWLAPTVVIVPYMIYVSQKFRKKFNKGIAAKELVTLKID
jgi:uncharacterized membrane protein